MISDSGTWLPSVTIGLPVIIVSFLICVVLTVALVISMERSDGWFFAWIPLLAAVALVVAPAFGYWPWKADYHKLQPVTGVVQTIETRAFDSYYVVTYREGAVVRCDDSRCANVKAGDTVRLLCTKEHQWGSPLESNGWGCRWGGTP